MINMIKLGFTPLACCWVHQRGEAQGILAVYVASKNSSLNSINDYAVQINTVVQLDFTMLAVTVLHCIQSLVCIVSLSI